MQPMTAADRLSRSALLLLVLAVFFLIPLRIMAYGYMPGDDTLRHTAFAVANRHWGDLLLLDPRFPAWMDMHPGWHGFLRAIHDFTGWDQVRLVSVSVVLAYWVFTFSGALASGNPPAWFLACAIMSVLEPALLGKLTLGRPLFFTMTAVAVVMLVWTRRQPLRLPLEIGVVFTALTVNILMHPSSWYLWAIVVPPLVVCRQWRSLLMLVTGWTFALLVAWVVNGAYNGIVLPIEMLRVALLDGKTLGPNLVSEFQPTGGPVMGLLAMALVLLARTSAGADLRKELFRVDLVLVLTAWIMGLYVGRFWIEWGLPAMAVWFARNIAEGLGLGVTGFRRRFDTAIVFGMAAATLYLAPTADVGGRYTNALRNPLLMAPFADFAPELPEPGGVLYSVDMTVFYTIFQRMPDLQFRFSTGMEPGLMPAEDLKVLRAIQTTGLLRDYKPWFDKMTPKDRVLLRWPTQPQWEGMEFRPFYGAWMGRKALRGPTDLPRVNPR